MRSIQSGFVFALANSCTRNLHIWPIAILSGQWPDKYDSHIRVRTQVTLRNGVSSSENKGAKLKLLLSLREVGEALAIGESTTKALVRTGAIESIKIGDRRLVPIQAVEAYVANRRAAAAG